MSPSPTTTMAISFRKTSDLINARLKDSYIPLYKSSFLTGHYAGALVVAPHVAVTNDHNGNLIPENIRSDQRKAEGFLYSALQEQFLDRPLRWRIGGCSPCRRHQRPQWQSHSGKHQI